MSGVPLAAWAKPVHNILHYITLFLLILIFDKFNNLTNHSCTLHNRDNHGQG